VIDPLPGRSRDVSQTLVAPANDVPADADLAFEQLYRSGRDDVYAYVAGLLRDRSAAEDVTAAAFERAYRKRSRFDPRRGSPRAWVFGIARNAALDELRRRGRQAEMTVEAADDAASTPELAERDERRLAVRIAIGRLAARDRELISLKFFAGLTNPEIATTLGISESNAGTRLHRAVAKLREVLNEAA
jgi:RNA polymerase sigma factor (sigma-70 family)